MWREAAEKLSDSRGDGVEVSRVGFAQQVFELGAGRADGVANGASLVAAEIVDDDDGARSQGRDENLFDVKADPLAVDRAVEEP